MTLPLFYISEAMLSLGKCKVTGMVVFGGQQFFLQWGWRPGLIVIDDGFTMRTFLCIYLVFKKVLDKNCILLLFAFDFFGE